MRQIFPFMPIPVIAALLLAGCAAQNAEPHETWGFTAANEEPAKLIYGLEDSDIVSLGFTCRAGSGEAEIIVFASESETTWPDKIELRSGEARQTFDLIPPPQSDLPMLNAAIDPSSPLAVAFAQTGRLESTLGGVRRLLTASDHGERGQIADFWRTCVRDRSSKQKSR